MPNDPNKLGERSPDDLTRREWLLRLGETVALVGFSGVAGQARAQAAAPHVGSELGALPPGLYEPSNDYLSHALAHDDQFHAVPPGSETDYVRPRHGAPFEPQFFSPPEFKIVRRMVELMLGEAAEASSATSSEKKADASTVDEIAEWLDLTVSRAAAVREAARRLAPEHRILAVHHYGAAAVEEVEKSDPQKICRDGLAWLSQDSEGRNFLGSSEERQLQLLERIGDARPDTTQQNAGTRFSTLIKAGVIRGFYTSRAGLKELDNKRGLFYAESPGCARE